MKNSKIVDEFKDFLKDREPSIFENLLTTAKFPLQTFLRNLKELKDNETFFDTHANALQRWLDNFNNNRKWQEPDRKLNNGMSRVTSLFLEFLLLQEDEDKEILDLDDKAIISQKDNTIHLPPLSEGKASKWHVTRYERSPKARQLCISVNGYNCKVCGMSFEQYYGKRVNKDPYIEIHHIFKHADKSKIDGEHPIDYVKDLVPLCANCHRMVHYLKNDTILPNELKKIWNSFHKK